MAKDFRASQIRTSMLIATGASWPERTGVDRFHSPDHPYLGMVIMSGSNSSNFEGGFVDTNMFDEFGNEPWLVFSGVANVTDNIVKPPENKPGSAVLFLGDVIISGTLFGKRQVINVDRTVDGDFMVHDSMFVSGNLFSTPTTFQADPGGSPGNKDVIAVFGGDANEGPRLLFRRGNASNGAFDTSPGGSGVASKWTGVNRHNSDAFVVFSGSIASRGVDNSNGIVLMDGDLHVSGNVSVDGEIDLGLQQRDFILNNSASILNVGVNGVDFAFPDDYALAGGSAKGPFTTAGPRFGHATTASNAPGADHNNPFFVQEDAWQVHGKASLPHGAGTVPAFWYSDFVNSSSLDQQGVGVPPFQRLGGFRFIVAASGSGTGINRTGGMSSVDQDGNRSVSVFTVSGSGDIAIDPHRALVFDSRQQAVNAGNPELYRRVQILHRTGSDPELDKLIFSGAAGRPLHYQFVRGEVTGSGGIHLPPKDGSYVQGQLGQAMGISFQGSATSNAGGAGLFYSVGANEHPKFPVAANTLAVTASDSSSNVMVGAHTNVDLRTQAGYIRFESGDSVIIRSTTDVDISATGEDFNVKNVSDSDNTAFNVRTTAAGNVVKVINRGASGSGQDKSGLIFSGSGTAGANTIKTRDADNADNAHLTIKPEGALFMTGSRGISIDAGHLSKVINIGTSANHDKIQIGYSSSEPERTTEVEINAEDVDINASDDIIAIAAGGATLTSATSTTLRASSGPVTIQADGSDGIVQIKADNTVSGVQIATNTNTVPVTLGGNASMVTVGHNLRVNNDAEIVGNLTVRGDFIKGHVVTASLGDPLLLINSGSEITNSGGGIAISSGSSVVLPTAPYGHASPATFSPAMVFGRDTTTTRDTFLAGRQVMNLHPGVTEDLAGATPIDMRAAGYRTAAGMTLTSSVEQGVELRNPAAAGTLRIHAGGTGGGGFNRGNLIFSGSNYSFEAGNGQKIFFDETNDIYFESNIGVPRLDLNIPSAGAMLTGTPKLSFGDANHFITKDEGNTPTSLLLKANGAVIAASASHYSINMSAGQPLYFREGTDMVRWQINDSVPNNKKLELEMSDDMGGLFLKTAHAIYFNSTFKFINGSGQSSNNALLYRSDDEITIKSHGDSSYRQPSRVTVYATGLDETDPIGAGNGAILIMSGNRTADPDNGYASLGYSSNELDALGVMEGKHADVTLIFSGAQGQFPSKTTRGTSLFMGDVVFSGSVAVGEYIYHEGNESATSGAPQTAIRLQDRNIRLIASGTNIFDVDGAGSILSANFNSDSGQVSTQIKGYSAGADKPIFAAIAHDTSNRATFLNPITTDNPNVDPANGHDVALFFSGSKNTRYVAGDLDPAVRATALFGGDVVISGSLGVGTFELGNLTLTNANAHLRFFDANHFVDKNGNDLRFRDNNVGTIKTLTEIAATAVSTDLFSVTRTALNRTNYGMTTGSFSFDTGFAGAAANAPRSTAQASDNNTGAGNSDVYFFVSGSIGSKAKAPADFTQAFQRRAVALFGGDVHISGTLTSDNTTFGSSLDTAYDTNDAGDPAPGGGNMIIADRDYVGIKNSATPASVISNQRLFSVSGSAAFGQLVVAPLREIGVSNGYEYGGVFVTGSAGVLGFGVGAPTTANAAFIINNNNNVLMQETGGNSRKIAFTPNEASTYLQYTNANFANPGPKILNIVNKTASGRISFAMGSSGGVNGSGYEGEMAVSGSILPGFDSEYNLGSPTQRWANVYTGDLHLRNNRGDWTIYEERDMLVVVNNITGKKYKMGLTPLEDDE